MTAKRDTPGYAKWRSMINRCTNPNGEKWHRYGGRGISVCPRWMDFWNFHEDMGDPPPGMSLERKKNHLGYSKANCVWATNKVQANNRDSNRPLTFSGRTMNLGQWAAETGLKYHTLYARIVVKKWPLSRALTEPHRCAR